MKKIIFSFLGIIILTTIFFSCKDEEFKDDHSAPLIEDIKVNWGDTLRFKREGLQDTIITINTDTLNIPEGGRVDTVVLGKNLFFSGYLSDDQGLSSLLLRISKTDFPTIDQENGDSALVKYKVWSTIFGKKDTTISKLNVYHIEDSIAGAKDGKMQFFKVSQGIYNFSVVCMDQAGKLDSVVHKVFLIRRDSIFN